MSNMPNTAAIMYQKFMWNFLSVVSMIRLYRLIPAICTVEHNVPERAGMHPARSAEGSGQYGRDQFIAGNVLLAPPGQYSYCTLFMRPTYIAVRNKMLFLFLGARAWYQKQRIAAQPCA